MAPGEDFDQIGFELPRVACAIREDASQPELFADDFSQPDAADNEPVFWSEGSSEILGFRGTRKPDDFIQADALESV